VGEIRRAISKSKEPAPVSAASLKTSQNAVASRNGRLLENRRGREEVRHRDEFLGQLRNFQQSCTDEMPRFRRTIEEERKRLSLH